MPAHDRVDESPFPGVDLRYVRTFLEVVRTRNFTRAARNLHMTQQAASAHVRRLEVAIGVPLLRRTTREVEMTAAGAVFAADAERLLDGFDGLWARTRAVGRGASGVVQLGFTTSAGHQVVPELVAVTAERHPGIVIDPSELDARRIVQDLRRGVLDLRLVMGPLPVHDLAGWPLATGTLALLVGRAHRLADVDAVTLDDLAGAALYVPRQSASPGLHGAALALAEAAGLEEVHDSVTWTTVPPAIVDGDALGVWPSLVPARYAPATCSVVAVAAPLPSVDLWILHRDDGPRPDAAAVLDALEARWPRPGVG